MKTRLLLGSTSGKETGFRHRLCSLLAVLIVVAPPGWTQTHRADHRPYDEPFRPQFHFTPARNWTNDPNGLVFYKGEYHLFYQYNPFGDEWGHMSWGHAVSRDMVHWTHLPVAIPEQSGIMIFSGSAVVDWQNSSGLCTASGRGDKSCLVAIYTGASQRRQNQNIAYSNDRGRTWTRYSQNPVIDLQLADFRDPKVFWYKPQRKWVMVTVLSPQHKVRFFASPDLKHWTALSDFGPAAAVGGVWECPDLFELPVAGQPGETRWVLSINLNPGGVAGGSGNQYFVGRFDGTRFQNDNPASTVLWADYGKDFYASTSYSDIPVNDGRRIWMGWLNNWQYAAQIPTSPWRGAMTIPRQLQLKRFGGELRMVQQPVRELVALRESHVGVANQSVDAANQTLKTRDFKGDTLELQGVVDSGGAAEFGFRLRKGASQETLVGVDAGQSQLFIDRTRSGAPPGLPAAFAGRQTCPLSLSRDQPVRLHIYVDRSSVEVFANDGECAMSDLIFPSADSQGVEMYSVNGQAKVLQLDAWKLRSVWQAGRQ